MKKPSIKTTISALLIGILGTAIWEKFLSPFCTFIYLKLSIIIDNFTTYFSNITYKEISNGYNDSSIINTLNYLIVIFFLIIFTFTYLYIIGANLKTLFVIIDGNRIVRRDIRSRNHFTPFIITILVNIFMLIWMYWIGNLTYINDCKTISLCNLEIISPYVSDLEYKTLKSSFYSIQTKEDYEIFTNTIREIGKKYSLNLKE